MKEYTTFHAQCLHQSILTKRMYICCKENVIGKQKVRTLVSGEKKDPSNYFNYLSSVQKPKFWKQKEQSTPKKLFFFTTNF